MAALGVVILGGGAVWLLGGAVGAGSSASEFEEVVLPPLAPSLMPALRTATEEASIDLVERLRALSVRESLAESPEEAWLAGRYMASASQFPGVQRYWETMGRYAQTMQAQEEEIFQGSLAEALDSIPLPEPDRVAVTERAMAGFRAAALERDGVYGQLRAVIDASLTLHGFLVEHEADIDYEPAAGGLSRDPILEAVPITDALGEQMWHRVAAITAALDALGFLDRVTTERLLEVFYAKLEAVEVRGSDVGVGQASK